jgi:hypothetical protein
MVVKAKAVIIDVVQSNSVIFLVLLISNRIFLLIAVKLFATG